MTVRVMAHLVAGRDDVLDACRVQVRGLARDKESGFEFVLIQQVKNAGNTDGRAVSLVTHGHWVFGIAPADGPDDRLRIDVEREHEHRGPVAPPGGILPVRTRVCGSHGAPPSDPIRQESISGIRRPSIGRTTDTPRSSGTLPSSELPL